MIKLNPLFEYRRMDRQDGGPNGRVYVSSEGHRIPSVTTILSATKDMKHLIEWRKRVGETRAAEITKEAAGLGTAMHTHLESYVLGQPRPAGNNYGRIMARNMADTIINQGLCNIDEVWGVESHLHYDAMYAGTTDLAGSFKGQPAIMDFKNTIKPKKEEWIEDYFLQLVFYGTAHNQMFGTNIKTGVIFMCSRDCTYQEFVIGANRWSEYEDKMWKRLEQYYEKLVIDPPCN